MVFGNVHLHYHQSIRERDGDGSDRLLATLFDHHSEGTVHQNINNADCTCPTGEPVCSSIRSSSMFAETVCLYTPRCHYEYWELHVSALFMAWTDLYPFMKRSWTVMYLFFPPNASP